VLSSLKSFDHADSQRLTSHQIATGGPAQNVPKARGVQPKPWPDRSHMGLGQGFAAGGVANHIE
jgi:hypothetical protein